MNSPSQLIKSFGDSSDAAWVINENDFYAIKNALPPEMVVVFGDKQYVLIKKARLRVTVKTTETESDNGG